MYALQKKTIAFLCGAIWIFLRFLSDIRKWCFDYNNTNILYQKMNFDIRNLNSWYYKKCLYLISEIRRFFLISENDFFKIFKGLNFISVLNNFLISKEPTVQMYNAFILSDVVNISKFQKSRANHCSCGRTS